MKKKKRLGQALLEFGITIPVILTIFLGTIDIFNIATSYVQMTFLGNTFLNSTMVNADGFSSYSQMKSTAKRLMENHGYDGKGIFRFPAYFSFEPSTMEIKVDKGGVSQNDIGTVRCLQLRKKVKMLVGKIFVGRNEIYINKRVCGIQERKVPD